MAEESGSSSESLPAHHVKKGPCFDRKRYRDGKRKTAVKAYGIFDESRHLLVFNVPTIGVEVDLEARLCEFGRLDGSLQWLHDYPARLEEFTTVAHACFERLTSARLAKRRLDDSSFYGSALHVSFAPELETVAECRLKLFDCRKFVTRKYRRHVNETAERLMQRSSSTTDSKGQEEEKKKEEKEGDEGKNISEQSSLQVPLALPDLRFPPPGYHSNDVIKGPSRAAISSSHDVIGPSRAAISSHDVIGPSRAATSSPGDVIGPSRAAISSPGDVIGPSRAAAISSPDVMIGPSRAAAISSPADAPGPSDVIKKRAFSATVPVLRSGPPPPASRPRFVPRQVGEPAAKRARATTVAELKRNALVLGPEQRAQASRAVLAELRDRASVTLEPGLERARKDIRAKVRAVTGVPPNGSS